MKSFFALGVVALLVGCGTTGADAQSQSGDELGTAVAAICGKSNCPSGYKAIEYYCDMNCPNATACPTSYNAVTCAATNASSPQDFCGLCPSGYYQESHTVTAACSAGSQSVENSDNTTHCVPNPAPGGPSYTKCGSSLTACESGYHRVGSLYYSSACDTSAGNTDTTANTLLCGPN